MVEVIDLSDENDICCPPGSILLEEASAAAQSTACATNSECHLKQGKVMSDRTPTNKAALLARPPPPTGEYQPYTESFYIDFVTTIEHSFPWKSFAARYDFSDNELRHMFFVLVTLPLANPDDNSKRLKVAQGARNRFAEWQMAWEETVANV